MPDPARYSGVVEIAMLIVNWATMSVHHAFHAFVCPLGNVHRFVERNIHGLAPRFLARRPSWISVRESVAKCLNDFSVRHIVGVGSDIFELISSIPDAPPFQYWNLALPTWRERASANYTAVHAILWAVYSRSWYAQCGNFKHAAFRPTPKYSSKNQHKLFYGPHCALKDVYYMISAVHLGIEIEPFNVYVVAPPLEVGPLELLDMQNSIEGLELLTRDCRKKATQLIRAYVNDRINTPIRSSTQTEAPWITALFDPRITIEDRRSFLEPLFNKITNKIANRWAVDMHTQVPKPILVKAAHDLGSANFTPIDLYPQTLVKPDTIILITLENTVSPITPPIVKEHKIPHERKELLQALRNIRKQYPAATTASVLLHDIFPHPHVSAIKVLLRKIRALFCKTPITVITYSWPISKLLDKIAPKYSITHIQLDGFHPLVLRNKAPHLFRID